jgi:hypothetical protein
MARSDPHRARFHETHRPAARPIPVPRSRSALPDDAAAIIEPPSRSVTQAGRARDKWWLLRFRPRGRRFADPLTGWTGSEDMLAPLALRFPTREAAVRYAERHGLPFEVRGPERAAARAGGRRSFERRGPGRICCWPTGPHALCCGDYPLLKEREDVQQK